MKIRTASTKKDFIDIRSIWEERFTTDETYLNTIFKCIFPLCRSYIHVMEGKAVSVISLMPMNYVWEGCQELNGSNKKYSPLKGFYLFGVATLKIFEGKKLAAGLINYATGLLTTEGYDFIFERPANQLLNKYYFNLGFTVSLPKVQHTFPITKGNNSTRATLKSQNKKSLSDAILTSITTEHSRRFEWDNKELIEGLLLLGELDEHLKHNTSTPNPKETFIAIKILSNIPATIFKDAFFCFPME